MVERIIPAIQIQKKQSLVAWFCSAVRCMFIAAVCARLKNKDGFTPAVLFYSQAVNPLPHMTLMDYTSVLSHLHLT